MQTCAPEARQDGLDCNAVVKCTVSFFVLVVVLRLALGVWYKRAWRKEATHA